MKTQKLLVIGASVCLMAFFNVVSFAQTDPVQSDDVQANIGPFLMGMQQAEEGQCDIWTVIQTLADFLHEQQDELEECEAQLEECQGQQQGAPVPRTGQTQSYAAGDDGDLQKGVPWPDPRFINNLDGTVTDNLTGLIWLKDANCSDLVSGPDNVAAWSEAVANSNSLASGTCGLTDDSVAGDWRLPNIRELQSLVDYGNFAPSLPADHPFTNVIVGTQSYNSYWTSTTDPSSTEQYKGAFMITWVNANITPTTKSLGAAVWPVRGGN